MKRNNKKGFTIVELVVVIAVIAILAAVLIPTFSGVTTKANKSARDHEAKNAFTNYLADCDANPDKDAYIVITKSGTTYYYDINDNGQLDFNAATTVNNIVCTKTADGYTIARTSHGTANAQGNCPHCNTDITP